jgi:hypothetical protein
MAPLEDDSRNLAHLPVLCGMLERVTKDGLFQHLSCLPALLLSEKPGAGGYSTDPGSPSRAGGHVNAVCCVRMLLQIPAGPLPDFQAPCRGMAATWQATGASVEESVFI